MSTPPDATLPNQMLPTGVRVVDQHLGGIRLEEVAVVASASAELVAGTCRRIAHTAHRAQHAVAHGRGLHPVRHGASPYFTLTIGRARVPELAARIDSWLKGEPALRLVVMEEVNLLRGHRDRVVDDLRNFARSRHLAIVLGTTGFAEWPQDSIDFQLLLDVPRSTVRLIHPIRRVDVVGPLPGSGRDEGPVQ